MSQSKNSKKQRVSIVDHCGQVVGSTSLAHARRYVRRGVAELLPGPLMRFLRVVSEIDVRPFPLDLHLHDDRAVMKYWRDQRSQSRAA